LRENINPNESFYVPVDYYPFVVRQVRYNEVNKTMIQDQLVDYISSQLKLGVSRDAIKTALISAGWVAADVDDTLKKVGGGAVAGIQPVKPGEPMIVSMGKPASKGPEPQVIRVSDLVSTSTPSTISPASTKSFSKVDMMPLGGKISGNTFQATSIKGDSKGGSKTALVGGIVAVVLILALGGLAWYFYSANAGLASQVATLTGSSATVAAQLEALKSQVDASSTGLGTQIASLTAANADLALDLSFYVALAGSSTSAPGAASPIVVSGLLSGGGKAPYALTTQYGAKIFVGNSTDAKIAPQLKTVVGSNVQLTGTYIPGSGQMTVSSVATSSAQ
jgi:hypothetical protein